MGSKHSGRSITGRKDAENQGTRLSGDELVDCIQQYATLKQDLTNFVLEAEGEIAASLEAFSAAQLSRWAKPILSGLDRTELAIDMFLTEGQVAEQSVIELFIQDRVSALAPGEPSLSAMAKADVLRWQGSFNGLFEVLSVSPEGYALMNWLTQKNYWVGAEASRSAAVMSRLSPGEMLLARLLPLTEEMWIFSGPLTLLGKLGKPKLAVAIGNFKQWFPQHLYGDASDLKEAAWASVRQQHDDFLVFFGEPPVTLSGHALNKKLQVYQAQTTEKQLAAAGIDSEKSLQDMAKEAGLSDDELAAMMDEVGEESAVAQKLLERGRSLKMVMPEVSLPDDLRKAEAVTVFSHPRWGQSFLKGYSRLVERLADTAEAESLDRLVQKYLDDPQVNAHVWAYLAEQHGEALEPSLRRVLKQPEFEIGSDLMGAIARHGKSLTPTLPESASVPIHLHNLFQAAIQEVGSGAKKKGAKKKSAKKKSGFGA